MEEKVSSAQVRIGVGQVCPYNVPQSCLLYGWQDISPYQPCNTTSTIKQEEWPLRGLHQAFEGPARFFADFDIIGWLNLL